MTADTMIRCVDAIHSVVGEREDVIGFAIAIIKADAGCAVITRANTPDIANRLDASHDAIRTAINAAFTPTPARPALDAEEIERLCRFLIEGWENTDDVDFSKAAEIVTRLAGERDAALRSLADMRGQIERARGETLAWLLVIASARKASMGAIDNTYCPQINALRVDEAIATLKAALARCAPSQEGKSNV